LKRGHARRMVRMDVNKSGKVYDYLVAAGWVRPAAAAAAPPAAPVPTGGGDVGGATSTTDYTLMA
jgi:hypothetical protein